MKIEKGFSATGIFPYNPNIFSEDEFLSFYASIRKIPLNENSIKNSSRFQQDVLSENNTENEENIAGPSSRTPNLVNNVIDINQDVAY